MDKTLKESDLYRFIGSENYYKHWINPFVYTDGVQYLAKTAGAYWLVDDIIIYQNLKIIKYDKKLQQIQFWKLKVNEDKTALIICERDTDDVVFSKKLTYTDFPLSEITLYLQNYVLMLSSEY